MGLTLHWEHPKFWKYHGSQHNHKKSYALIKWSMQQNLDTKLFLDLAFSVSILIYSCMYILCPNSEKAPSLPSWFTVVGIQRPATGCEVALFVPTWNRKAFSWLLNQGLQLCTIAFLHMYYRYKCIADLSEAC